MRYVLVIISTLFISAGVAAQKANESIKAGWAELRNGVNDSEVARERGNHAWERLPGRR